MGRPSTEGTNPRGHLLPSETKPIAPVAKSTALAGCAQPRYSTPALASDSHTNVAATAIPSDSVLRATVANLTTIPSSQAGNPTTIQRLQLAADATKPYTADDATQRPQHVRTPSAASQYGNYPQAPAKCTVGIQTAFPVDTATQTTDSLHQREEHKYTSGEQQQFDSCVPSWPPYDSLMRTRLPPENPLDAALQ